MICPVRTFLYPILGASKDAGASLQFATEWSGRYTRRYPRVSLPKGMPMSVRADAIVRNIAPAEGFGVEFTRDG